MPAASQPSSKPHMLHPSILREYDIRGIVGETLFEADAYAIGRAFASELTEQLGRAPIVCVARDGRLSSPALSAALIQGFTDSGAQVWDAGTGPTPMLYFAAYHLQSDGGIMVTGSHNPPTHNGFKCMRGRSAFFGEEIKKLGMRIAAGNFLAGHGTVTQRPCHEAYVTTLKEGLQAASPRPLSIAWDPGNGAAGEVVEALIAQLPGTHHAINTEIDGHFPNHHPDPSVPKNLQQLIKLVTAEGCDVGLAFDGDGDRLGVVDNAGRIVSPDHLLMLLARDVLSQQKGTIIADVKTSQTFFDDVKAHGGDALMYKTGHSHIKAKMKEIGALFAGEASGHIFFADRYFGFDDGIYAAIRLLGAIQRSTTPLANLVDALPSAFSTPEIRLECPDDRKFIVVEEVKARLQQAGADFSDIDGVRVQTADGWWLIRASNTQAVINARCEAATQAQLDRLIEALSQQLEQSGLRLVL